jgi:transketolase
MRTAFIDTVMECAQADERIWLICGDIGYSVLERFAKAFPQRYVNAGVAEQNMAGMAGGLALTGKTVITYSIGNFGTLRCLEQIRNDICAHHANVKIVAVGGGLAYGGQGYTHHAVEDLAIMRSLPNLTVLAPGDPMEARLATKWMLSHSQPCYMRLGKAGERIVHVQPVALEYARVIPLTHGTEVQLISTGGMLETAIGVAALLREQGVDAGVASSPFVKPFDTEWLRAQALRAQLIVTIEEHTIYGGLGDAAAAVLAGMTGHRARLVPFGVPEGVLMGMAGDQKELRARAGLAPEAIAQGILGVLQQERPT